VDGRDARHTRNEVLFREVNERIEEVSRTLGPDGETEFLCECGRDDCVEPVPLTVAEYENVRSEPNRFVIVPGHQDRRIEALVSSNDRFSVVEKIGEAAEAAEESDPRAEG